MALDADDGVIGFAHTGPLRDDDLTPDGRAEVFTLYVHPTAWRTGVGRELMARVEVFWASRAVRELFVWVFEANEAARAFYASLGFAPDGVTQVDDFGGAQPVEVRYRRTARGVSS